MATRGLRRKKSSLTECKIAVIGAPGVGKSALIVRFMTNRYIGEYDHESENRYKHEAMVDGDPILFEILDSCTNTDQEFPNVAELRQWADGFLLVYSITDRHSLNYLRRAKSEIQWDTPVRLVGNKMELVHMREVGGDEVEMLAEEFNCKFREVSAVDQVKEVAAVFLELSRELLALKRKAKQSLLGRMFSGARPYYRTRSDSSLQKD